jgi:hypothetical protein
MAKKKEIIICPWCGGYLWSVEPHRDGYKFKCENEDDDFGLKCPYEFTEPV